MNVKSAEFKKGVTGPDDIFSDNIPQVAFMGRSNVGKSSVINSLTNQKDLAHSSATPGRTREINFFLINKSFYLVDLPGYGYARGSFAERDQIIELINWYAQQNVEHQKIVVIIDAKVGPTDNDLNMLRILEQQDKHIIVVANKIDKLKSSELKKSIQAIQKSIGDNPLIPYSAVKKIGVGELYAAITKK